MRTRCRRADHGSVELVGPRLWGPDDAVDALRLSAEQPDEEGVVILVCDRAQRIVLGVDFPGAGVPQAADAVGYVVEAGSGLTSMSLVVGVFRDGSSTYLDEPDVAVLTELVEMCQAAGVPLLDVILVAGHRWRSLAEAPGWKG